LNESPVEIFAAEAPNMTPDSGKGIALHFALANPEQKSPNSYPEVLGGFRSR
jgi:hypothetical protein